MKKLLIAGSVLIIAAFAGEGYKVLNKIKIGGTGGWDYIAVDPNANRVYASHATLVEVVDTNSGKVVGQITQLHGVHGVTVAPEFGKGFITNGQSNSVTPVRYHAIEQREAGGATHGKHRRDQANGPSGALASVALSSMEGDV